MRVLWVFLTMLEGWIGSIGSIDNLDWSLLIGDISVWFFFAFGLYIGEAVWASSLSLSCSSFLVVLFVLLIRRLTIFNALTFARWYALTVFSPRDLRRKRHFYTMPEKLCSKSIRDTFQINDTPCSYFIYLRHIYNTNNAPPTARVRIHASEYNWMTAQEPPTLRHIIVT